MTAFVFIESNTTGTGELFVRKAIARGLLTYFLTRNPEKYHFLHTLPTTVIAIDTADAGKVAGFCELLDNVVGVFSSSENFVDIASDVATRLGLQTGNSAAIRTCRDKRELGDTLAARGIGTPKSQQLSLWLLEDGVLEALPYPVVIKPRTGSGSVNVKLISSASEAHDHCQKMRADGQSYALAQQYVRGAEYSVETLTVGNRTTVIAVIKKYLGEEPDFVEIGHSYPCGLGAQERQFVEDTVCRALDAVGFRFGPAHTELRLHEGRVTIIEINPRLAGGLIPLMLDAVFDTDVLDHVLDIWTSQRNLPEFTARRYGAIRFAMSREQGVLARALELATSIREHPDFRYFHTMKQAGEIITLAGDFRDRVAAIICAGEDRSAVEALANRAVADLEVHLTPTSAACGSARPNDAGDLRNILGGPRENATGPLSELAHLLALNEAHLVMLGENGLASHQQIRGMLNAHRELRHDDVALRAGFTTPESLHGQLEDHLSGAFGDSARELLRTGRSRDDIDATFSKLKLRHACADVLAALERLRTQLVLKASQGSGAAAVVSSQYPPAMPGTMTQQLLGFEQVLAKEAEALLHLVGEINVCPMGAGAGSHSAIDRELVSKLLGFARPSSNGLDAVGNAGVVLHLLACLNAIAILLSRFAQDLQAWSAFPAVVELRELPVDSGAQPAIRGATLFEFIIGHSYVPVRSLASCSTLISRSRRTDSFELGSQVSDFVTESTGAVIDMLQVATALLRRVEIVDDAPCDVVAHSPVVASVLHHGDHSLDSTCAATAAPTRGEIATAAVSGAVHSKSLDAVAQACNGLAAFNARFRQFRNVWREADAMRLAVIDQIAAEAS